MNHIIDKYVEKISRQLRDASVGDDPPPTEEEIREGAEFIVGNMLEGMGYVNPFTLCDQCDNVAVQQDRWSGRACQFHHDEAWEIHLAELEADDQAAGMQP